MKISIKVVLIVLLFITIGIFIFPFLMDSSKKENTETENDKTVNYNKLEDIVFTVKTSKVLEGDLIKYVTANGIVKPIKELDVVSNINGVIKSLNVYDGKKVNKGDLLVKFDDREYQIAVNEAEVKMTNAKIDYGFLKKEVPKNQNEELADSLRQLIKELKQSFNSGQIDEPEFLKKKDELDNRLLFSGAKQNEVMLGKSGMADAINMLNRANLNLNYTEIIAPFSGLIANCNLLPSQRINAGGILCKLIDDTKLKVDVGVLENEITNIKVGNKAEVLLNAVPGKIFNGYVKYINPIIDPDTKTFRVTIEIPNYNEVIKAGMFANVKIEAKIFSQRLLVLKDALLVRDNRNLVFVAEAGLAKWHYVDTGEQNEKFIEIKNGIVRGDSVIIEGNYTLAHDAKIKVTK